MTSRTLRENGMREQAKKCKAELQQDLITMLAVVTFDRFGVIRDYLYERDENDEYFFGIPKGNKIKVNLLASAEDLYKYLAEESEGGCLIAKKDTQTN